MSILLKVIVGPLEVRLLSGQSAFFVLLTVNWFKYFTQCVCSSKWPQKGVSFISHSSVFPITIRQNLLSLVSRNRRSRRCDISVALQQVATIVAQRVVASKLVLDGIVSAVQSSSRRGSGLAALWWGTLGVCACRSGWECNGDSDWMTWVVFCFIGLFSR